MPFNRSNYTQFNMLCLSSPGNSTAKSHVQLHQHKGVNLANTLGQQQEDTSVEFFCMLHFRNIRVVQVPGAGTPYFLNGGSMSGLFLTPSIELQF